jgi:hypothetical protein
MTATAPPTTATQTGRPSSILVWGPYRQQTNAAALVIARRLDPNYRWIEVTTDAVVPEADPAPSMTRRHAFVLPSDLPLPPDIRESSIWSLLQENVQPEAVEELRRFLCLPERLQIAVTELSAPAAPTVLVLANADRVEFPQPAQQEVYKALGEILRRRGVTLIITRPDLPPKGLWEFDFTITALHPRGGAHQISLGICQGRTCSECVVFRHLPQDEIVCRRWVDATDLPAALVAAFPTNAEIGADHFRPAKGVLGSGSAAAH